MNRTGEFFQKAGIFAGTSVFCGSVGFAIPLLYDRDVGGALAAVLGGILGIIGGLIIAYFVVRQNFD